MTIRHRQRALFLGRGVRGRPAQPGLANRSSRNAPRLATRASSSARSASCPRTRRPRRGAGAAWARPDRRRGLPRRSTTRPSGTTCWTRRVRTCQALGAHGAQASGADRLHLAAPRADRRPSRRGRADGRGRMGRPSATASRTVARMGTEDYGLTVGIHAHAAGFIDFEPELERLLDEVDERHPQDLLRHRPPFLCRLRSRWRSCSRHIGPDLLHALQGHRPGREGRASIAKRTGFYDACGQGIFCNLGKGDVDFPAVRQVLVDAGFEGWCTVEQDCDPTLDREPRRRRPREPRISRIHRLQLRTRHMTKLNWGMIGGGEGSQIGPAHRLGAAAGRRSSTFVARRARPPPGGGARLWPAARAWRRTAPTATGARCWRARRAAPTGSTSSPSPRRTPPISRSRKAFLEAGFHVLCEKPMTMTVEEGEEIVRHRPRERTDLRGQLRLYRLSAGPPHARHGGARRSGAHPPGRGRVRARPPRRRRRRRQPARALALRSGAGRRLGAVRRLRHPRPAHGLLRHRPGGGAAVGRHSSPASPSRDARGRRDGQLPHDGRRRRAGSGPRRSRSGGSTA